MRSLENRIQHLEQLRLQQRKPLEEIGRTNVGQLTKEELWNYLALCLGRPVAEVRAMSDEELERIASGASRPAQVASELLRHRWARNKIRTYFPVAGPLRRELYPKHLEFFRAGADTRERCFMAGNRTGKSDAAAYETTVHLTGDYPQWWEGRRFDRPIKAWAAGDTNKTVRDILQEKLLGRFGEYGTGMIPGDALRKVTGKQGIAEAADQIQVRHVSGGTSILTLKSYEEGRKAFQGAGLDLVWLDEEAPCNIYDECLMRLMVSGGCIMLTFTPLNGLTDLVLRFLPGGRSE
jgi:phage terminase large subunit-like protein